MLAEEFLKQRIDGMPNEDGVMVTQAFPKILYVLEDDNYKPGTKYWDLTKLAIKCSSNRLTPDYISEKKMMELKNGDCYACMGL
nr:MAG TPA: anaerobic ribonucleoside triphosphate reductase [Caudoviricetes sp.]